MEPTNLKRVNGYFEKCVQAVSESPYGRDAREPIACALERIDSAGEQDVEKLSQTYNASLGSVAVTPISGSEDRYRLTIERVDNQ